VVEQFDLIVFDWDGTLIDSTAAIARAIQDAAAELRLPVPSERDARHVIGLGLADALSRAVPSLPQERIPEFSQAYRRHYFRREDDLTLFDGVRDLLAALQARAQLAIATGKHHVGLQRALEGTGLRSHFAATRCSDQTYPKPHPAMLLELMDELAAEPARTLMIGDTTHDLEMAEAAGVAAVALTQGAHPRDLLIERPSLVVLDSIDELHRWLIR
jgi:phosphoglycolate phosphatase